MTRDDTQLDFTPAHHALLFAWISRAVVQRVGAERGEAVVREGVRRYGQQRGRRMALRAQAHGEALSMFNYLIYGEWRAEGSQSEQRVLASDPHFHVQVTGCPWHAVWQAHDLIPYGRLYCLEIDEALVRGYNPRLKLSVNATLPNDLRDCDFVFHDAHLTPGNLELMEQKKQALGLRAVMPWDYHLGHLYKTVGEVVVEELGAVGQEALGAALAEFARRYGEKAAQTIKAYEGTDFDRLPGPY
jgi:hypothetical protein